jgi:hypothetical protein
MEHIMNVELFVVSLCTTVVVVTGTLAYLRGITRSVLTELCPSSAGTEYWLRVADVLAISGSLILVLAFGGLLPSADLVTQLRLILGLALAGIFITVVLVASNVWRNVVPPTAGGTTADAAAEGV